MTSSPRSHRKQHHAKSSTTSVLPSITRGEHNIAATSVEESSSNKKFGRRKVPVKSSSSRYLDHGKMAGHQYNKDGSRKEGKHLPDISSSHRSRHRTRRTISESTHEVKRVQLSTQIPTGSPTFQRAMKGLHVKDTVLDEEESSSPEQVRRRSKGGGSSLAQNILTSKPHQKTRRLHFKDTLVSYYHDSYSDDELEDDLDELQDRVSRLPLRDTKDLLNAVPTKSILKNRRRSIDDLDVGTKRGLAEYLRAKQREALSSNSGYI